MNSTDRDLLLQLIYSGYSCSQGWFFTPCISDPSLRLDILHRLGLLLCDLDMSFSNIENK